MILSKMVEIIIVVATLLFASLYASKNVEEFKHVCSNAFVLFIAVGIAFSLAEFMTYIHIVDIVIEYSPFDILSITSFLYLIAFFARKGKRVSERSEQGL